MTRTKSCRRPRRKPVDRVISRVYCRTCGGLYQQELGLCTFGCSRDGVDAASRPPGNLRVRVYVMKSDQALPEVRS